MFQRGTLFDIAHSRFPNSLWGTQEIAELFFSYIHLVNIISLLDKQHFSCCRALGSVSLEGKRKPGKAVFSLLFFPFLNIIIYYRISSNIDSSDGSKQEHNKQYYYFLEDIKTLACNIVAKREIIEYIVILLLLRVHHLYNRHYILLLCFPRFMPFFRWSFRSLRVACLRVSTRIRSIQQESPKSKLASKSVRLSLGWI